MVSQDKAYISRVLRKLVFRKVSVCVWGGGGVSSVQIRNFKPLAIRFCCTARIKSELVRNPKDRLSRDAAHIFLSCKENT